MNFHCEVLLTHLGGRRSGLFFMTDQEHLGGSIAAVLEVRQGLTVWVCAIPSNVDVGVAEQVADFETSFLPQLRDRFAGKPFVEQAVATPDDPTGHTSALSGARIIARLIGGSVGEAPGGLAVYLPGEDQPEVVVLYPRQAGDLN